MKKTIKYVMIDMGYGPAEHWCKAKVIHNRKYKGLFGGEKEDLLVEVTSGERLWVSFWKEIK